MNSKAKYIIIVFVPLFRIWIILKRSFDPNIPSYIVNNGYKYLYKKLRQNCGTYSFSNMGDEGWIEVKYKVNKESKSPTTTYTVLVKYFGK